MTEHELIDTKAARKLLGVKPSTLALLCEQGDLGDVYWWNPTGKQKRILLHRGRVEALAAQGGRKRPAA
jgi:hypothetical protein